MEALCPLRNPRHLGTQNGWGVRLRPCYGGGLRTGHRSDLFPAARLPPRPVTGYLRASLCVSSTRTVECPLNRPPPRSSCPATSQPLEQTTPVPGPRRGGWGTRPAGPGPALPFSAAAADFFRRARPVRSAGGAWGSSGPRPDAPLPDTTRGAG